MDIVSKNGSLLLNIGPRPDGTIPEPEVAMLRAIGGWLRVNGEAIYGTRPWTQFGEGPTRVVEGPFADTKRKPFTSQDVRFTTEGRRALRHRAGLARRRAHPHQVTRERRRERTERSHPSSSLGATAAVDLVAARGRPARATAGCPSHGLRVQLEGDRPAE